MAKVKTALQTITAYLKGKGYDVSEIKDVFAELEAADVDLDTAADAVKKNADWGTFWTDKAVPQFEALTAERDALQTKIEKLKLAGVNIDDSKIPDDPKPKGDAQYVTAEQLKQFERNIANANSGVMKQLTRVGLKHYQNFNEEPDLDAIEKLIADGKAMDVEDAYSKWSAPKYEEKNKKSSEDEIARRVKEGVQAELSKQGVRNTTRTKNKATDPLGGLEKADLSKPAPTDRELRDAFLQDINEDVAH